MNYTITYDPIYHMYNVYEIELTLLNGVITQNQTFLTSQNELKDAHHFIAVRMDYKEFTVAEIK